ncbi:hypothetical protein ASG75_09980 [Rhodanobacter sp. Soil772]|nr:hypothetical protein ASG75_09980 [Rhodanobacter sp. Soil772]
MQRRTLPISQYQALFSLLGTAYGGNGSITFLLPDLRSRTPYGMGATTRSARSAAWSMPQVVW